MDEPKETQDNSSEDTKETSKEEPETFTGEQVKEAERKAKSDALAELGRLKKANESLVNINKKTQERIVQIIQSQEDEELARAGGDEEKLSAIKERQARRKVESELVQTKSELEGEKAKTAEAQEAEAEHTKERNAREVATRLGVNAKTLMKFTDGSVEAMEDLAKDLPKKGEPKDPLKPDSGKTTGGGKSFTRQQIADMSTEDFEKNQDEINAARRAGRIK